MERKEDCMVAMRRGKGRREATECEGQESKAAPLVKEGKANPTFIPMG